MRRTLLVLAVLAALLPAAVGRAAGPLAFHVSGGLTKLPREQCAVKAVEAMGLQEMFIFAEVTPEGDAVGWDEDTLILVTSVPLEEGLWVGVFAVGRDNQEAERLRNAVREYVFNGPHDPTTPKRIEDPDPKRKPCGLTARWGVERRPFTPTMRLFNAGAQIVLERNKFAAQEGGQGLVFGARLDGMASAFSIKGPLDAEGFVGVVVAHEKEKEAERARQTILSGILKMFFE